MTTGEPSVDRRGRRYSPERMLAFSDGVFAIAITLLILPLGDLQLREEELGRQLLEAAPDVVVFVLGFGVIGLYWLSHHSWLSRVRSVDDRLLRINLLVLLCIGFLPFPTSVLGDHGGAAGTAFYAGSVTVTGIAFVTMWFYLVRHPDLLEADSAAPLRHHSLIGLITPAVFAASIPVAFLIPRYAPFFWILTWPVSTVVGRILRRRDRTTPAIDDAD